MGLENIKDIKEVMDLAIPMGMAFEKSMSDNEITLKDAFNFVPVLRKVPPAFRDMDKIIEQYNNSSDADWEALLSYCKTTFDLRDDKLEETVEGAFSWAVELAKFLKSFRL